MVADDLIRPIAHHIWIIEGQPDGRALDHWLEAYRVALTAEISQPWYNPSFLGGKANWMHQSLWLPQPYTR
jgi:hypothetical protein